MTIRIDGHEHRVPAGASVAVALLDAGIPRFRTSVQGEPRGPVCGMGICFECRVTIDGHRHQRACLVPCVDGMAVDTRDGADV
ncbi:MAG: (2Fe-2S)-binding protein [Gemmatimonadota bacterium]|nr:(2Fe-2S)-binding protein [Gemmatimonadota bacterium]